MGGYFLAAVFYQAALKELVSWFDGGVEYEFYGLVYGYSGSVVFWSAAYHLQVLGSEREGMGVVQFIP